MKKTKPKTKKVDSFKLDNFVITSRRKISEKNPKSVARYTNNKISKAISIFRNTPKVKKLESTSNEFTSLDSS